MKNLLFLALLFLVACNDETPAPSKERPYKSVKDRALIENVPVDTAFEELKKIDSAASYYTDLSLKEYKLMNSSTAAFYSKLAVQYGDLYERKYREYLKSLRDKPEPRPQVKVLKAGEAVRIAWGLHIPNNNK